MRDLISRRAVFAAFLSLGAGATACSNDPPVPNLPTIFSKAQAKHGRQVYDVSCASCHGGDLEGGAAPALTGPAFLRRWAPPERSAEDLFSVLRTSMPKLAMGSLSPHDYEDVFAYVLQRNGWPPGARPFDGSDSLLRVIRFERLAESNRPASLAAPDVITGERSLPVAAGPSQAELTRPDSGDWVYHTGDLAGQRYSRLAQLSPANVGRLAVTCVFQVGSGGTFQTGPLVYHGVMYVTTVRQTVAMDAATCRPRWRYTWQPRDYELWPMNRGAAIAGGYLVRGTADGYLLALDAADGKLVWARHVASPDRGETITMPPLVYGNLVAIGPAGGENGIRGWIGAFRLADGRPVWKFNTIPQPGEPGAETWADATGLAHGGGALWTPLALDAAKGELYAAVTNPAPDLAGHVRPGADLYTNALVVLDARTGALRWYEQLLPGDTHDWDLTQVSPVFEDTLDGRPRHLVATTGKAGLLTVLDRDTHRRVYEVPITTRLNADLPVGKTPTRVCPGIHGGVAWNGPAYDPRRHLLYVAAVDWCGTYQADREPRYVPGRLYLGGTYTSDSADRARGWLTAVDAARGTVRWRYQSAKPMLAGVTATAGGLVFTGELTGDFLALDAATGRVLYRFYTGSGVLGGVVTYAVHGRQYVAVASGGGSYNFGIEGSPTVLVFGLGPEPVTAKRSSPRVPRLAGR